MKRSTILLLVVALESVAVILAVYLGDQLGTPAFGQLRLNWLGAVWGILACLPLLAGLWFATRAQRPPPLGRLTRDLDNRVRPLFADCDLVSLAIISAAAGIGEETLFRGVMQTAMAESAGLWVAIAVTSVIFGLLHYVSLTYAIYAALIGAYLGLLLVAFDNLLVPILAHATYDFIGLVYLVYVRKAPSAAGESDPFDLELGGSVEAGGG